MAEWLGDWDALTTIYECVFCLTGNLTWFSHSNMPGIQNSKCIMVHAVINVCMKHIYKIIYDLSVGLVTFDLGLHLKVKSRSQTFQGVVSHKWYII